MNDRLHPSAATTAAALDAQALAQHVNASWRERIVPALRDYIAVPAKSPMFAPDWAAQGHLTRVLRSAAD